MERPYAWTGTEMLVAQGGCCDELGSVDLAAYNPATNTWRNLPPTPLTPRDSAVGTWTGSEMIVAGGFASADHSYSNARQVTDGAAWDAATNRWHAIAAMPTTLTGATLPAFPFATAVWTGREMLVWSSMASPRGDGHEVVVAYKPSTSTWRRLPPSGLAPRYHATAVWTGHELVVWGGINSDANAAYDDGARLDPATDTWRRLPPAPVPARGDAAAAWSGREVLVWGGDTGGVNEVGQGAAYDPATNQWRALPFSPLRAKSRATGVWTGRHFFVMGGTAGGKLPAPGPGTAAYDPSTNAWTVIPAAPHFPTYPSFSSDMSFASDQRDNGVAVWTGTAILFVGGGDHLVDGTRNDGAKWTPSQ